MKEQQTKSPLSNYQIISIGDIHGRTNWIEIVEKEIHSDRIIFLGDYFDPYFDISHNKLLDNFNNIINLKNEYPNKIVLLLGNHDICYISDDRNNRYDYTFRDKINKILLDLISEKKIKICHFEAGIIFSHAGVSNTWLRNNNLQLKEKEINSILFNNINKLGFKYGESIDYSGDNVYQSPVWIRPRSLTLDSVYGYDQVIGHTKEAYDNIKLRDSKELWLNDKLEDNKYLVFNKLTHEIKIVEYAKSS